MKTNLSNAAGSGFVPYLAASLISAGSLSDTIKINRTQFLVYDRCHTAVVT
jgi:hypothetical protein